MITIRRSNNRHRYEKRRKRRRKIGDEDPDMARSPQHTGLMNASDSDQCNSEHHLSFPYIDRCCKHRNHNSTMSSQSNSGAGRGRDMGMGRAEEGKKSTAQLDSVGGDAMTELTSTMSLASIGSSSVSGRGRSSSTSGTYATPTGHTSQLEAITELMKRPGRGTVGRMIPLRANYFEMRLDQAFTIHRYEVLITRPGKTVRLNRDLCREAFWRAAEEYRDVFGKFANLVYDDSGCLWTADKLDLGGAMARLELRRHTANGARTEFVLDIQYTTTVTIDQEAFTEQDRQKSAQFLDSLVTQSIRCPLRTISTFFYPFGRSVYLIPNAEKKMGWAVPISTGIEAWTGLHGAIKIDDKGQPLFNADVSTSVFYKLRMDLIDFFMGVINDFRGKALMTRNNVESFKSIAMNETQRRMLKRALKGMNLQLTYGGAEAQKKAFKFVDVLGPACQTRFNYVEDRNNPNDKGREVTVEEYFAVIKNIGLRFPYLPVLHVGSRMRKMYIPMELLILSDKPQKVLKELTEFQKSKLIRGASMEPKERKARITYMMAGQDLDQDNFLVNYGVSVSKEMVAMSGRVLPPPRLALYQAEDRDEPFALDVKDGKWPLCNQLTASPQKVLFAGVIVDRCINANGFFGAYKNMVKACQLFGARFVSEDPLTRDWDSERTDLKVVVQTLMKEAKATYPDIQDVQLIFLFIMQARNLGVYANIKTVCDIEMGVACQVMLAKTFAKMVNGRPETNATAHNMVLKINVRLGGINNKIHKSYSSWPKFTNPEDSTIFVGIDVTHPKPGKGGNSLATVVASVDVDATRYGASVKVQEEDRERVVYVVDSIMERLLQFYRNTGSRPNHIIIYRDGISESDFLNTMREELASVMAACKKLQSNYNPTIAYVVVQKRHHTRFFVENDQDARGSGNIPPGTVIDERVVSAALFDFFLSSHLGAIGTSRPAHYYVLYDSWYLNADEWQQLTYALCHLYGRCNKSVSIPAPVYYAHLACARAGVHDVGLFERGPSSMSHDSRDPAAAGAPGPQGDKAATEVKEKALKINSTTPDMYFI